MGEPAADRRQLFVCGRETQKQRLASEAEAERAHTYRRTRLKTRLHVVEIEAVEIADGGVHLPRGVAVVATQPRKPCGPLRDLLRKPHRQKADERGVRTGRTSRIERWLGYAPADSSIDCEGSKD